jgi:hypothetical protein
MCKFLEEEEYYSAMQPESPKTFLCPEHMVFCLMVRRGDHVQECVGHDPSEPDWLAMGQLPPASGV